MESIEVCIVGGGMAGASVAYHLAPHARVTLLEREPHLAYHSTGRSAALYAPNYSSDLVRRLTLASGPFLNAPPPGFTTVPLLHERGFLLIGKDSQREARDLYENDASTAGLAARRVAGQELLSLVPALRPESCDWALLDPYAWDIDVDALFQGFLRGARALGATVRTSCEAVAIRRAGTAWHITGMDLDLRADIVVNAAGAWADECAGRAEIAPLGLVPHRRTAFIFDPPENLGVAHWPMVTGADDDFYFKPDAGRLLGSLSEETPSGAVDAQADDLDVAIAVDRIEQVLDFPVRRVLRSWAGLRVFGPDRDPVSGFEPGVAGFYWHAGLGGVGIQTSPALGAFAAAIILGRSLPGVLSEQGVDPAKLQVQRLRR